MGAMRCFGATGVVVVMAGQVLADPVLDLYCLDQEWQQAITMLHDGRAEIWARVDDWLTQPAQAGCDRVAPEMDDWLSHPSLMWRCDLGGESSETTLTFEAVDAEKLENQFGVMTILGLVRAIEGPAVQQALDDLMTDMADVMVPLSEAIAALPPETLADLAEETADTEVPPAADPAATLTLGDLVASVSPLQNDWGLTANITMSTAPAQNDPAILVPFLQANRILQRLSGLPNGRVAASATDQVRAAVQAQADVWSTAHLPLAAARFRLFDAPFDAVTLADDSITVVDLASWRRAPGTDWQDEQDTMMLEGVNALVFFYEPQSEAVMLTEDADCTVTGSFPCTPLNGGGALENGSAIDVPASCDSETGCTFTTEKWVNDHVAVHTILRGKRANTADVTRFAESLMTRQTAAWLAAFDVDPSFDLTICAGAAE